MIARPILLGTCLFAVAACSKPAEQITVEESGQTQLAERAGGDAVQLKPALPASIDAIPDAFLGIWDSIKGSCSPASDLRMEISPQQIIFYESLGTVQSVTLIDDRTVDVTLSMEGEGETWQRNERLTLEQSPERLIPSAGNGETAYDPLPRKRCPQ